MLVPFIEASWLALSLRLAGVVGTLVGTAALLLLPSIRIIGDHRWYWLPTVSALATTVFLAHQTTSSRLESRENSYGGSDFTHFSMV